MTREEVIQWMQEEKARFERAPDLNGCPMTECWQKAIDVYDMAISALRQQDQSPGSGKMMQREPMTNADRIRAMNDEELAKMLWKAGRNYRSICADPVVDYNEHYEHLIDWLQQPCGGGQS